MQRRQPLGKKFLASSAFNAYAIWIILVLFPLVLAGTMALIDERRSPRALLLAAIAIGIVAASYIFRFYLVRNTESLRAKVLNAKTREEALEVISGGFWWWSMTLTGAITAAVLCRDLL